MGWEKAFFLEHQEKMTIYLLSRVPIIVVRSINRDSNQKIGKLLGFWEFNILKEATKERLT